MVKDNGNGNPYGTRRIFAGGSLHRLDAMTMLMADGTLPFYADLLKMTEAQKPILDMFMSTF